MRSRMKEGKPRPAESARGAKASAEREERLARALRANLGRRKAQACAKTTSPTKAAAEE